MKKVYRAKTALKFLQQKRYNIIISGKLKYNHAFYMNSLDYSEKLLYNAAYEIINDADIIKKAIKLWGGYMLKYASDALQKNDDLARMALLSDYTVILFLDLNYEYNFLYDKEFLITLVKKISTDFHKLLKTTPFSISRFNTERDTLLITAICLWKALPNKYMEAYEILTSDFVNPCALA